MESFLHLNEVVFIFLVTDLAQLQIVASYLREHAATDLNTIAEAGPENNGVGCGTTCNSPGSFMRC